MYGIGTIMKTPTDEQLKQTLAKMLPNLIEMNHSRYSSHWILTYAISKEHPRNSLTGLSEEIKDTELLHLCWLAEETFNANQHMIYHTRLSIVVRQSQHGTAIHATWQQRVIALAEVKGIDIV